MTAEWMGNVVETTLGPAKATRQTRQSVRTPTGGVTYTYQDAGWSYCNIAPMSAEEIELSGRMGVRGTFTCRISKDLDVDQGDRIVISETGGFDELDGAWEVTAVMTGFPMVDRLLYLARFAAA